MIRRAFSPVQGIEVEGDIRNLADEELMLLVQRGEPRAFELLYDRHDGVAFSLAYRMMGSRSASEDIVQEAFLSVWRSRLRYDPERGSVRTWLLGIVHNRGIDALRRTVVQERRQSAAEEMVERTEEVGPGTEIEAVRRDEARSVREALGTLPTEQRQTIELAYFGGFSQSQIAEMLDTPVGTVKGRMRLGLEKLRHELDHMAEGVA